MFIGAFAGGIEFRAKEMKRGGGWRYAMGAGTPRRHFGDRSAKFCFALHSVAFCRRWSGGDGVALEPALKTEAE
jgi:hypothetical protein